MFQHLPDQFFGGRSQPGVKKVTQKAKKNDPQGHLCLLQAAGTQILSCPELWDVFAQDLILNVRWKTHQEGWKGGRLDRRVPKGS